MDKLATYYMSNYINLIMVKILNEVIQAKREVRQNEYISR